MAQQVDLKYYKLCFLLDNNFRYASINIHKFIYTRNYEWPTNVKFHQTFYQTR